jgi:quinol monooxygenase YgiN
MLCVRDEEGTPEYAVYRGAEDPAKIVFYERYRDEAALEEHGGEPLHDIPKALCGAVDGHPVMGSFEILAWK